MYIHVITNLARAWACAILDARDLLIILNISIRYSLSSSIIYSCYVVYALHTPKLPAESADNTLALTCDSLHVYSLQSASIVTDSSIGTYVKWSCECVAHSPFLYCIRRARYSFICCAFLRREAFVLEQCVEHYCETPWLKVFHECNSTVLWRW